VKLVEVKEWDERYVQLEGLALSLVAPIMIDTDRDRWAIYGVREIDAFAISKFHTTAVNSCTLSPLF
jgi:hypothetical protein